MTELSPVSVLVKSLILNRPDLFLCRLDCLLYLFFIPANGFELNEQSELVHKRSEKNLIDGPHFSETTDYEAIIQLLSGQQGCELALKKVQVEKEFFELKRNFYLQHIDMIASSQIELESKIPVNKALIQHILLSSHTIFSTVKNIENEDVRLAFIEAIDYLRHKAWAIGGNPVSSKPLSNSSSWIDQDLYKAYRLLESKRAKII